MMKSIINTSILVLLCALPGSSAGAVDEFGHDYSKIDIVAATYGSGENRVSVKEKVIDFLVTNPRKLVVTPRDLGADPTPGWNRELQITHRYNGKERVGRWGENSSVYSISLCVPATKEELEQWLPQTHWSVRNDQIVFFDNGTFGIQKAGSERIEMPIGWAWKVMSAAKIAMSWGKSSTIECSVNESCTEIKELTGMKYAFKRLPSPPIVALPSLASREVNQPTVPQQTPVAVVGVRPSLTPTNQQPPNAPQGQQRSTEGIALDSYWDSPLQGGRNAMQELATLISPFAKPARNTAPSPGLKIFEGVTYLMPYEEARKILNLNQRMVPKSMIESAGFPRSSLYVYAFDGTFEGHFNKLYLMTDKADQVVSVHLVAGSPKRDLVDAPARPTDWHTYNFVNARAKAVPSLWIGHKQFYQERGQWSEYRPTGSYQQVVQSAGLLRIDSVLIDPNSRRDDDYRDANWRALEAVRWYVPQPLMELILHCIRNAKR